MSLTSRQRLSRWLEALSMCPSVGAERRSLELEWNWALEQLSPKYCTEHEAVHQMNFHLYICS